MSLLQKIHAILLMRNLQVEKHLCCELIFQLLPSVFEFAKSV